MFLNHKFKGIRAHKNNTKRERERREKRGEVGELYRG